MYCAGGNEQQIGFAKRFTRIAADEFPMAARYNINLILGVGRLRIGVARCVNFNQQTPVFEHGKRWKPLLVAPAGVESRSRFGESFKQVQSISGAERPPPQFLCCATNSSA